MKQPALNKFSEKDLFNTTLTLTTTENQKVYLLATVKQQTEIYHSRSETFIIKSGINNVSQLHITQSEFSNAAVKNTVKQTSNFPTGEYTICIRVMRKDDDEEIGNACITHTVVNEIEQANVKIDGGVPKKKIIRFYGYGSAEYFYANRQGPDHVVPQEYFRADMHPSFSMFDVPVTANVFYSTEKSSQRQDIVTYNLEFDNNTFRNTLKMAVLQRLKSIDKSKAKKNGSSAGNLNDLEDVNKQLENKDYNGLEEKIKSQPDEKNLVSSLTSLSKSKDSLEQFSSKDPSTAFELIKKKKQINDLQEKYRKLQELKHTKEKYESLYAKKTELTKLTQQIDNVDKLESSKNIDYNSLNDPEVLRNQLKRFGLFHGVNKSFYGIRELKIGTCFPYYSPLVLDEIQVQGASAEVNIGRFFMISATGGKTQDALISRDSSSSVYKQKMIAIKTGVGNSYGTHFFLTGLKSLDEAESIKNDSVLGLKPRSNYIAGGELQVDLFKHCFITKFESGFSEHIRDQRDSIISLDSTNIPVIIPAAIRPNYSTSADFAYIAGTEIHLNKNNTILKGSYRKIGPGYVSFGAPFLRKDVQRIEISAEQKLLEGQLALSGFYKKDHDNQLDVKGITTTFTNFGASARIHFKRLPYLDVSYMPSSQENNLYKYKIHIAAALAGYSYTIKQSGFVTTASYSLSKNETNESANKFRSDYLMLNQSISFPSSVTLSVLGSYINYETDTINTRTYGGDVSISFTIFKRLNPSFGFTYYNDNRKNKNTAGFAEVSVMLLRYFTWIIRGEYKNYNSNLAGFYNIENVRQIDEYQVRTSLIINW